MSISANSTTFLHFSAINVEVKSGKLVLYVCLTIFWVRFIAYGVSEIATEHVFVDNIKYDWANNMCDYDIVHFMALQQHKKKYKKDEILKENKGMETKRENTKHTHTN